MSHCSKELSAAIDAVRALLKRDEWIEVANGDEVITIERRVARGFVAGLVVTGPAKCTESTEGEGK